jgi:hypothetical protein
MQHHTDKDLFMPATDAVFSLDLRQQSFSVVVVSFDGPSIGALPVQVMASLHVLPVRCHQQCGPYVHSQDTNFYLRHRLIVRDDQFFIEECRPHLGLLPHAFGGFFPQDFPHDVVGGAAVLRRSAVTYARSSDFRAPTTASSTVRSCALSYAPFSR